MTLRRATILVHAILSVALVAGAAWVAIATASSFAPDPDDPGEWGAVTAIILIPVALLILGSAAVVAFTLRSWMRSGNRSALVIGNLLTAVTLALLGILIPAPIALGILVALALTGATVAANKPATAEPAPADPSRAGRSTAMAIVLLVAAVVVGAMFVVPIISMFWLPI